MAAFISRHRLKSGIASAMTLSMVFVIVLLMGLVTFIDIRRERTIAREGLERYGVLMANSLDEVLANDLYFPQIDALEDIAEVLVSQPQIAQVKIFRPDGRLLVEEPRAENRSGYVTGQLSNIAALDAVRNGKQWRQFGESTLELAIPVSAGGDLLGGVQFSFTAEALNEEIRSIILAHLWQGLALIALGTGLAYLIARYTARSIGDLAAVAGEIGRGNLDVPAPSRGTKETVELGRALEGMRVQLKELYPNLEQRVQERTTELSRTAQLLQVEVAEREKAEQEQRRLTEESQLVAGIGRVIGSSLNVVEVYEGFAALVGRLVPCDWITINMLDLQRGTLTLAYTAGAHMPGRAAGTVLPLSGTFTEAVAQSPRGLVLDVDDCDECALNYPGLAPYLDAGVRSFLGVPVVSHGEVIATLFMVPSASTAYTERHLELARNIGAQIAGAIANAEIYSQREKAEQGLLLRNQQLGAMFDIASILSQPGSFEDRCRDVLQALRKVVPADLATMRIHDERTGGMRLLTYAGPSGWLPTDVIPSQTATGSAYRSGELIVANDYPSHPMAQLADVNRGIKSAVFLPIKGTDGRPEGVVNVVSLQKNHFTAERVRMLGAIVDGVGALMESVRLSQALVAHNEEMAVVDEVGRLITTSLDLDQVYERFAGEVKKLVDFDRMAINVINEDAGVFTFKYAAGLVRPGQHIPDVVPLEGSQTQRVLETAQTLVMPDISINTWFSGTQRFLEEGLRSSIMVPLIHQGRVLGTMSLRSRTVGAYTPRDQTILERLASQIAPAVENAQLYDHLRSNAEEMTAIDEVARIITSNLDIDQVYERFATEAKKHVPFDRIYINRLDVDSGISELKYVSGVTEEGLEPGRKRDTKGTQSEEVLRTGESLVRHDIAEETRFKHDQTHLDLGMRSSIAIPLISKGEIIGILGLRSRDVGTYDLRERSILERLASQIAPALENAHLFEQLKGGQERLRNLSQRLVEVQEAERRHVARELHDEIGQVLTGLKFSIELISRLPEEAIKANLEESKNLVNELMGKVRDLSLDLRPAMLDDLGLLPTLLWYFERFTIRTQVDVGFEHTGLDRRFLPEVETTAYRIVQEALTNVARHAGADGVSVRLWSNDEVLGLSIEDHGAGFDASDESILNKSNGLAGMRERATLLGGRLTLESAPGLGTNLFAELPFSGRNHISMEGNEYDNHSLGG